MVALAIQNGENALVAIAHLPRTTVKLILKIGYALDFFFPLNQTAVKLSLLILYHRIFSASNAFRYTIYGVGAAQISWGIAILFTRIFPCTPIHRFWDREVPGTCVSAKMLLIAPEVLNTAIDFFMVGMAVWMVHKLQMPTSTKRKLSLLFALGGFDRAGLIGIIKIADSYTSVGSSGLDALWDVIQMTTGIICCTTPIYRSLLALKVFRTLTSIWSERSLQKLRRTKKSNETLGEYREELKETSAPSWPVTDDTSTRELQKLSTAHSDNREPSMIGRQGVGHPTPQSLQHLEVIKISGMV
ncbi:hypothetical protein O1611_g6114 [Lasiodiplodia mahajangana]|uniref:Uncharacterized protein n=1 Tax=Lasiodiplodia mahajangana TaxID=1108764 RepID=A0ACC2JJ07_9PEZI|nr:hypothetical protein O1611_g6114 [Lasiodiplodia mahajangana]